jgi:hypothetical protein
MKKRYGFNIGLHFWIPLITLGIASVAQRKQAAKFYTETSISGVDSAGIYTINHDLMQKTPVPPLTIKGLPIHLTGAVCSSPELAEALVALTRDFLCRTKK